MKISCASKANGLRQKEGQFFPHIYFLLPLLLFISIAYAADPGSPPAVLSSANTIYTMTADYSGVANGYNITATNVTLDCAGHYIQGTNITGTYGVYSTQTPTTVQNCRALWFNRGIYFNGANNGAITNSTGISNASYGIYLLSSANNSITNSTGISNASYGIYLNSISNNNTITNSTGIAYGSGIGIYVVSSANNSITNSTGIAYGSGNGIRTSGGSNKTTFTNTTASSATNTAFYVEGGGDVSIDCQGSHITGNNLSGDYGIHSTQFNTTIRNCDISNFQLGIYLQLSNSSLIEGNNVSSSLSTGRAILVLNGSDNLIRNNTFYGDTYRTIDLQGIRAYNNSFINNTATTRRTTGGGGMALILTATSGTNYFINNTFESKTSTQAVYLYTKSNGSVFIENTFKGASSNYLVYIETSSGNNTFFWNNFTGTTGDYLYDTNGSNYYNSTINGQNEGNIWENTGSANLSGTSQSTGFPDYKVATSGASYPYQNTTSGGKLYCTGYNETGCVDYAPLFYSPATPSAVCANLSASTTMTEDALSTGGVCFNITAANVKLDCAGFNIVGSNTTDSKGVLSNQVNTTIINCNISNFSTGIYFNVAQNGTIKNSNVSSTSSFSGLRGIAAAITNGTNTLIEGSRFYMLGNGRALSFDTYSDGSVIANSTIVSGSSVGIYISASNISIINTSSFGVSSQTISIDSANGASISNTTSISNSSQAIYLRNCMNLSISHSTFQGGTIGIYLSLSNNSIISENIIKADSTLAALLIASSSNNLIANNTINGSGVEAILFYEATISKNLTFINNTLISATNNIVSINAPSYQNTFYWNNFTSSTGYYILDINGSNYYNTSANGTNRGNFWYNVMNGSVAITGTTTSPWASMYYGSSGAGYPYNNSTSFGKFNCNFTNCADFAPLTGTSGALNSCTYSGSGNWYINCADICNTTSDVNLNGNNIIVNNTVGRWNVQAKVYNFLWLFQTRPSSGKCWITIDRSLGGKLSREG